MHQMQSTAGATISYENGGSGPPLVLVHGSFSDHRTNWEFVLPRFQQHYTTLAVARRGRGKTDASDGHTLHDEAEDVVTLIRSLRDPVYLLGHSYGAHVALSAAAIVPGSVRKLVLYEPPRPDLFGTAVTETLLEFARAADWDGLSSWFFRDVLLVPIAELDALRETELWAPILADARASVGDVLALSRYDFRAERFARLHVPVLLQVGTESPAHLYATEALAAVLPDCRIGRLAGQAHEGMTTAPEQYADAVISFLAGASRASRA